MRCLPWLPCVLIGLAACGGGKSSTPTSPTTPANHAPVISGMTVTPQFGMSQLTSFTLSCTATDSDGDTLLYSWDLGDESQATGATTTRTYTAAGTITIRATVSDSKGGSATDTRQITVAGLTGQWSGTVDVSSCAGRVKPMTASLTQSVTTVTGTFTLSEGLCSFTPGTAPTDPAEPGTLDANGNVRVRLKIPPYTDVYFQATIDSTGRKMTGGRS